MPKKIFTLEEKEAIIHAYTVEKKSAAKIGEQYGCSNTTLLKNLKEWGISANSKKLDLTNKQFGDLIALYPAPKRNDRYTRWVCRCSCGTETEIRTDYLTNGHTTSCGCKRNAPSPNRIDLTGQQFGEWTVLQRGEKEGYWLCKCSCGTIKEVYGSSLKNEKSLSCGHLFQHEARIPIIGNKYGNLTVLKQVYENETQYCICKCDCGNTTKVKRGNLVSGNTQSCGCISSRGEARITRILESLNIPFVSQYHPQDIPKDGLKFDFFVDNFYMIEFDGPQHYGQISGYYTEEAFQALAQNDLIKNKYCLEHNIPLYRIPYDYRDTIEYEDFTNEKFLVKQIDHYNLGIIMEEAEGL